ncbi:hypothetical protein FALBO_8852 [Fusarium albosuccineum]|uniref:Uncharacterized protein n=1 Tax=Fusarium albosuccineum TaxID=1237068 RepID=A0A8H4LAG2_9HYPO|nr:hypothetical protein FALBO_8852 [Fusarium albosuccineum]
MMEHTRSKKDRSFLGTFGIQFDALDFSESDEAILGGKDPDWDHVAKLKKTIRQAYSWSPGQIPALIDRGKLEEVLQRRVANSESADNTGQRCAELDLGVDIRVKCLRGWHEYLAADAVLAEEHKRWDVSLYSSDIDEATKTQLIDELLHQREISNAEFFYRCSLHRRHHQHDLDPPQNIWLNVLTHRSKDSARQMKRLLNERSPFLKVLETFQDMPALFWGFTFGQVNKMSSLLCRPLCGGDQDKMKNIDVETIKQCSGKAPGFDPEQRQKLEDLFHSRKILGKFNEQDRSMIWDRLQDTTRDRLIPTLQTFFGNLEYLRHVTRCLRFLFDINDSLPQNRSVSLSREILEDQVALQTFCEKSGNSLRQELRTSFRRSTDSSCLLQVSEDHYKLVRNQVIDPFELAYRQLLLFAFREFPKMPWQTQQKLAGASSTIDPIVLFKFATLAHKLGFHSRMIVELCGQAPGEMSQEPSRRVRSTKTCALYGKPRPDDLARYKRSVLLPNIHQSLNAPELRTPYFLAQRSLFLDLMHIFPFTGIGDFLDSAAANNERCLFENTAQQTVGDADVEGLQRTCLKLQEIAFQLSNKRGIPRPDPRDVIEARNASYHGNEDDAASLESRKRGLEAEIRQLSQQARNLRDQAQQPTSPQGLFAIHEIRNTERDESYNASRPESPTSQYEDASLPTPSCYSVASWEPGCDEPQLTIQLHIKDDNGACESKTITVTKSQLKESMIDYQLRGYKLFDSDDKVLTPYMCFEALQERTHPVLILSSEFELGGSNHPPKRRRGNV